MAEDFLRRWSRRKREARKGEPEQDAALPVETRDAAPSAIAHAPAESASPPVEAAPPLPPVESLSADSDFSPFMRPEVDAGLRREALKKLLHDPRFNVMDGLDVYIDDYSKPDPLPEGWLGKLNQLARLGDYQPPEEPPQGAPEEKAPEEKAPEEAAVEAPGQVPEAAAESPKPEEAFQSAMMESTPPRDA